MSYEHENVYWERLADERDRLEAKEHRTASDNRRIEQINEKIDERNKQVRKHNIFEFLIAAGAIAIGVFLGSRD